MKTRDFIQKQRIQKLTSPKLTVPSAVPKKKEKAPKTKEPESRHGKVCWADKYEDRKFEQGYAQYTHAQRIIDKQLESLTHPPLLDAPYSSGEKLPTTDHTSRWWSPRVCLVTTRHPMKSPIQNPKVMMWSPMTLRPPIIWQWPIGIGSERSNSLGTSTGSKRIIKQEGPLSHCSRRKCSSSMYYRIQSKFTKNSSFLTPVGKMSKIVQNLKRNGTKQASWLKVSVNINPYLVAFKISLSTINL